MIIFKTQDLISAHMKELLNRNISSGFVPTMGALHQGHLSLIEKARNENTIVVCSIFINPTQFNNPDDFRLYPVSIEKDIEKLESAGCDILFLPSVSEIYPDGWKKKHYDLGEIESVLEGSFRPGHFQGVCQVVDRLLEIIQPQNLYLGQKDLQQCLVIKKLLRLKGSAVKLITVPTKREADGLAMSSRNLRLNRQERKLAAEIFKVLDGIRKNPQGKNLSELKQEARTQLEGSGFRVDYIEIAHADDLTAARNQDRPLVALAAASIGNIRLIDNLFLN